MLITAPSAILTKEGPSDDINTAKVAQDLLGKTIYVDWPYLKEAVV